MSFCIFNQQRHRQTEHRIPPHRQCFKAGCYVTSFKLKLSILNKITLHRHKIGILVLLFSLIISTASAQALPDFITKKIDSLFTLMDTANNPGSAIGIIQNDSLIYAKGYGLANLEYEIPITPETIFNVASVSKQFTAYCIVLLARQGKLQLDDDIHKYISWFPDLKEEITIRNLLHHTSGIRDYTGLLAIAGTKKDDVLTTESISKTLSRQHGLNFKPGDKISYSNSNYMLLAEIVKSVSGQTLRQFADSAIFKPLHMTNTHFIDNYREIVKGRSYSYERIDSAHFVNSISSYACPGPSSLFTNIDDMAKWIMNFYKPKAGDEKDIDRLLQKGRLNDGKEIPYALGINVDSYKGTKFYVHLGADAGYRIIVNVIPDIKMGFMVFSNDGNFFWNIYNIMGWFIKDTAKTNTVQNVQKRDSANAIIKDITSIKKIIGNYIADDGQLINFSLVTNKLYANASGQSSLLWKDAPNTFSSFNDPASKFIFTINSKSSSVLESFSNEEQSKVFIKYTDGPAQTDALLQSYTGTYYSDELEIKYTIILKRHHLILTNKNWDDAELTLLGNDNLIDNFDLMSHLFVLRNSNNKIIGFQVE